MHPDDAEFEAAVAVMVAKLSSLEFGAWRSSDGDLDTEAAFAYACFERLLMLKSKACEDEFIDWCEFLRDALEAMCMGYERHRAKRA